MMSGSLLFVGLLVAGIVLVRSATDPRPQSPPQATPSDPVRILAERYAHGEIDESEYRQRLAVLRR
jgi:putative membrane protein